MNLSAFYLRVHNYIYLLYYRFIIGTGHKAIAIANTQKAPSNCLGKKVLSFCVFEFGGLSRADSRMAEFLFFFFAKRMERCDIALLFVVVSERLAGNFRSAVESSVFFCLFSTRILPLSVIVVWPSLSLSMYIVEATGHLEMFLFYPPSRPSPMYWMMFQLIH